MEYINANGNYPLNVCENGQLTGLNLQIQREPIMYENNSIEEEDGPGGAADGDNRDVVRVNKKTNLIINYLPEDMMDRELRDMFRKFGGIRHLKVIRDPHTGFSYSFGFVDFKQPLCAAIAQYLINGREVRGKRLKVSFARPRSHATKNAKLYVSRLPQSMNEMKLRYLFGLYGNVLDVHVLRNKYTGRPRGVAFVRFDQHMAAEMAREALDQYLPPGAKRHIDVRFVTNKIKPPHGLKYGMFSSPQQVEVHKNYGNNKYRQYMGLQNGKMIYEYYQSPPQRSNVDLNNLRAIPMGPPQKIFPESNPINNYGYYNYGQNNNGFDNYGYYNTGFNQQGFNYHPGYNYPVYNNSGLNNTVYNHHGPMW